MGKAQCVLALMALCVGMAQSWDIAISVGDVIEFYTNDGTKTVTVYFKSYNLTALAYDEVHDMMLFVDKQTDSDSICGYKLSFGNITCFVKRSGGNIHSLAFDPVTESLFFTDTIEKSINSISLKTSAHVSQGVTNVNLVIKMNDRTPMDIAVCSCTGYIYWTNSKNSKNERIEIARFDGSDRRVQYTGLKDVFGLAVHQQEALMYYYETVYSGEPYAVTVSKDYEYSVDSSENNKTVWQTPLNNSSKTEEHKNKKKIIKFYSDRPDRRIGIAGNFKIREQIQGIPNCKVPSSLVASNSDELICVHGMKVSGQSVCKCSLGYTGERCDVSTCDNYCLQGTCSNSGEGLPKCRCHAGYIGERCEMNACHDYCLNNGTCSLNGNSEPVCQCVGDYNGDRCDVSVCQNYCFQGSCSFNDQGLPKCRCHAGYFGERCEMNACHDYCLNNGTCSLNGNSEPVCQCVGDYNGDKCDVSVCHNYCFQGSCSFNDQGLPKCRCHAGYSGERCEVNVCFSYCLNDGDCSLNEEGAPVCHCVGNYEGSRCGAVKHATVTNTSTYYSAGRNLTLADLLSNWRKPSAKITITVEV